MKIALILLVASVIGFVEAKCCNRNRFQCCGKGPCNIFCCNCDGGGCRKNCPSSAQARDLTFLDQLVTTRSDLQQADAEMFHNVDAEGRGYFTYADFLQVSNVTDNEDAKNFFDRFDRNLDGKITIDEMREV